jgi:hypothetical protein
VADGAWVEDVTAWALEEEACALVWEGAGGLVWASVAAWAWALEGEVCALVWAGAGGLVWASAAP